MASIIGHAATQLLSRLRYVVIMKRYTATNDWRLVERSIIRCSGCFTGYNTSEEAEPSASVIGRHHAAVIGGCHCYVVTHHGGHNTLSRRVIRRRSLPPRRQTGGLVSVIVDISPSYAVFTTLRRYELFDIAIAIHEERVGEGYTVTSRHRLK